MSFDERERLILEHLPQVRLIARRLEQRTRGRVSLEDLVSIGVIGLISAIDNFDPAQNVQLNTYAEYKIRGAILDSLRRFDWAPRRKRSQAKQISTAVAAAEQRLQRTPTEEDVAEALGIGLDEYHQRLVEIQALNMTSLDPLIHIVSEAEERLPSMLFERSELARLLAEGIGEIPAVEQTVLSLYYTEELTLREIAQVIEASQTRVHQLKSQAILRLRNRMEAQWPATGTIDRKAA